MSRVPLYMHKVAGWEVTNTGLTTNKVERLEGHRVELEEKMVLFKDLTAQHAALTASKQEVAKRMQALFREVETLAAFVRAGLRQHYGKDSEQLIFMPVRARPGSRRRPRLSCGDESCAADVLEAAARPFSPGLHQRKEQISSARRGPR